MVGIKRNTVFCLIAFLWVLTFASVSVAQAADTVSNAFQEISKALVGNLPHDKEFTMALTPIRHHTDQCSQLSFDLMDEFGLRLFNVKSDVKIDIVVRSRLESILEEHKLSRLNLFSLKDQKKLGELTPINSIVTANISDQGQVLVINAQVTDIVTGKMLSIASAEALFSDSIKDLMERRMDCVYVFKESKPKPPEPDILGPKPGPVPDTVIKDQGTLAINVENILNNPSFDPTQGYDEVLAAIEIAAENRAKAAANPGIRADFEHLLIKGKMQCGRVTSPTKGWSLIKGPPNYVDFSRLSDWSKDQPFQGSAIFHISSL